MKKLTFIYGNLVLVIIFNFKSNVNNNNINIKKNHYLYKFNLL